MKLSRQIELYAAEENKEVLQWLVTRYSWQSKWNFVAKKVGHAKPSPSYMGTDR